MQVIKSQEINLDSASLFAAVKTAISSEAAVYALPGDSEEGGREGMGGSGKSKKSRSLAPTEENKTSNSSGLVRESLTNNKTVNQSGDEIFQGLDISDEISLGGTVSGQVSFNPLVLPPAAGGMLVLLFLAMIDMSYKQAQLNYEMVALSAEAMIGTDGQNGLIGSWVQAGCDAAKAKGQQQMYQAIGSLVGGIVSGISVATTVGGFVKNSTNGIGPLQTERGKLDLQLTGAKNYRNLLDGEAHPDIIAGKTPPTVDSVITLRKQELIDGVNIDKYKGLQNGGISGEDVQTQTAAKHLLSNDRVKAKAAADKQIENLQNKIASGDTAQQNLVQFLRTVTEAGSSAGQSYGGIMGSEQTVIAGVQETTASVMQQAGQATESVKEKAASKAQSYLEDMVRLAESLAQALAAQVKG